MSHTSPRGVLGAVAHVRNQLAVLLFHCPIISGFAACPEGCPFLTSLSLVVQFALLLANNVI